MKMNKIYHSLFNMKYNHIITNRLLVVVINDYKFTIDGCDKYLVF